MLRFLANRLLQSFITLLVFVAVTFAILQAMPGDITLLFLQNPKIPPEVREAIRQRLGLDRPILIQFLEHVKNVFTGNLGVSFSQYPRPVWDIIAERLPRTVTLFFTATIVSFYIGFILGRVIAWRRGAAVDYIATGTGVVFFTAFYPLLALILMWALAYQLKWLPLNQFIDPGLWRGAPVDSNTVFRYLLINAGAVAAVLAVGYPLGVARVGTRTGRLAVQAGLWGGPLLASIGWWSFSGLGIYALDIVRHMVLPVLALSLINFGGTMLLMRDSMLETIREDYVLAARARGLPDRVVRDRYAARTALLPVVTSLTLSIGFVVSGGIVTETVFSWPGLGQVLLESAIVQDYPLAIGTFTFTGIFVLIAHMVGDILNAVLDPRLRIRGGEVTAAE